MQVKELIELLSNTESDLEVWIYDDFHQCYQRVIGIAERTSEYEGMICEIKHEE